MAASMAQLFEDWWRPAGAPATLAPCRAGASTPRDKALISGRALRCKLADETLWMRGDSEKPCAGTQYAPRTRIVPTYALRKYGVRRTVTVPTQSVPRPHQLAAANCAINCRTSAGSRGRRQNEGLRHHNVRKRSRSAATAPTRYSRCDWSTCRSSTSSLAVWEMRTVNVAN